VRGSLERVLKGVIFGRYSEPHQPTLGAHTERQMRNFPKLAEKKTIADFRKINKIRVFENDEHFEFLKEKKKDPNLSVRVGTGRSGRSSGWSGLQCTYYTLSKTSKNIGI
jgi:hypothetical protein